MTFAIGKPLPGRLFHDFETASRLDLIKCGSSRYSNDSSTWARMVAWAYDDGEVRQWSEEDGDMPDEILDGIQDDRIQKNAWNATFEKMIWQNVIGIPINHEAWTCTMTVAMSLSLPGKLESAGKVVRLSEDELKLGGTALINKFAKPRKPTKAKPWEWSGPETDAIAWDEYKTYNRRDVTAERAIWKKVRKYDLRDTERELYLLDQEINNKGMPISMAHVRKAIAIRDYAKAVLMERMRHITGLSNPNSGDQLLPWLQDYGYVFEDLKKGHVERGLEMARFDLEMAGDNSRARFEMLIEVLDLKSQIAKTSVTKLDALTRATDEDGYLRHAFQFAGAGRTSRWAGRLFQAQNLAKPTRAYEKAVPDIVRDIDRLDPESFVMLYDRPLDAISSAIRPMVQSGIDEVTGEEREFADADLSAIENITLGWMSGESKIINVFAEGRDPYVDFAQYMYNEEYEKLFQEFLAGDKSKRTVCKPGVLGCGYQLGAGEAHENEKTGEMEATGLLGYAWNMKVMLTQEQAKESVRVWRATFTNAVAYWKTIGNAAIRCVETGKPQWAGPVEFRYEKPFLRMYLPSGRALSYLRPQIKMRMTPWGARKPSLVYEGLNDKRIWSIITTHGGKLTENADQAISRDILGNGMLLAKKEGLDLRLHVHDQLLTLGPKSQSARDLEILKQCMAEPPPWAPDIPLNVAGFTDTLFMKD